MIGQAPYIVTVNQNDANGEFTPTSWVDSAYRAASGTNREVAGWNAVRRHPDIDLLPELDTLAGRSADLVRNHGIGAGIISTIVDSVIGHTWRVRAQPDTRALGITESYADGWRRDAEALWRQATDTVDWSADRKLTHLGQTRLLLGTELVEGEALALPLFLEGRGGPLSTKMQLVAPSRLTNPPGKQDGDRIRRGIEIDEYGASTSYWIRKTVAPGQFWFINQALTGSPADWENIPAYTPWGRRRVIHLYNGKQIDATHGAPEMSPVLASFKMLDHYERAELEAAVVQSRITAIMETMLPPEAMLEMFGGKAAAYLKTRDMWMAKLSAGSILQAFPGDKLSTFNPSRPVSGFSAFCDHVSRRCGLPVGLPLELVTKDFSKTNYSSARAALLEAWRSFLSRRQWLATYWADPCYELVIEEAVNKKLLKAPNFYAMKQAWCQCSWIAVGRGWVDPVKEAQAGKLRVDGLMSTLQAECAEQGIDWEEVLVQRARELKRVMELEQEFGVTFPSPQFRTGIEAPGEAQTQPAGPQDGGPPQ